MRGNSGFMFVAPRRLFLAVLAAVILLAGALMPAQAADLPLAAGSPLAGISFDDRPLLLPVQRNFQMAMLTASSQIGRSCGRMEAYGWRMSEVEQKRVNLIFSNTVDRLRALGYTVEAQAPSSVSKDITLFTADRSNKHFLFMWSAGEIGLVMVLCESSEPMTGHMTDGYTGANVPPMQHPSPDVLKSNLEQAPALPPAPKGHKTASGSGFTPVGDWVGDFTCMRGYTGGTLHIASLKGENFSGTFRFYPTTKNPYVAKGSYEVSGQYDAESQRILINPGKWLEHPPGFYKTIIVGSFDPDRRAFSGFFQGIMGCTSFEAKAGGRQQEVAQKGAGKAKPKKAVKKASVTKAASKPSSSTKPAADAAAPTGTDATQAPSTINMGDDAAGAAGTPPVTPPMPAATGPDHPAPAPLSSPPGTTVPPSASAPAQGPPLGPPVSGVAPSSAVPGSPPPPPPPVPSSDPRPTSSLERNRGLLILAGCNCTAPLYPTAQPYVPNVARLPPAAPYPQAPHVAPASQRPVYVPQLQPARGVQPSVPRLPQAANYPTATGHLVGQSVRPTVPALGLPNARQPTVMPVPEPPCYAPTSSPISRG